MARTPPASVLVISMSIINRLHQVCVYYLPREEGEQENPRDSLELIMEINSACHLSIPHSYEVTITTARSYRSTAQIRSLRYVWGATGRTTPQQLWPNPLRLPIRSETFAGGWVGKIGESDDATTPPAPHTASMLVLAGLNAYSRQSSTVARCHCCCSMGNRFITLINPFVD